MSDLVQRFDFGTLGRAEEVPGGGIRVPAYAARTGIQVYRDASGKEWREYRDASEVFAEASLKSYADAPVTVGHPPGLLSLETRRSYERGMVRDASEDPEYRADGERWVRTWLTVTDAEAVRRVLARELTEVSMGYEAQSVPSSRADADTEQRGIRINHLALLPSGHARAGRGAAVKLDSGAAMAVPPIHDSAGSVARPSPGADAPKGPPRMTVKIKLDDGRSVEEGSPEHISHLTARADALAAARDSVQAKLDTEAEAHGKTKAALAEAQAKLDAQALAHLRQRVKPLTGEAKLDGMDRKAVLVSAIKAKVPTFDAEGRSEDYLEARVDALLEQATEPTPKADAAEVQPPRLDAGGAPGSFTFTPTADGSFTVQSPAGQVMSECELARLDALAHARTAHHTYKSPLGRN